MMTLRTGRSEEVALDTRPGETEARVTRTPRARGVAEAGGWEGAEAITGQDEPQLTEARREAAGETRPRAKRVEEGAVEQGREAEGGTTDCIGAVDTG